MRFHPRREVVLPVVLVLLLLGGGVAGGQTAEPVWSDELFANLVDWSAQYNAQAGDAHFRGKSLIRGERVDLLVRGADGSVAVYSFDTDGDTRIVDLRQGASGDATLRLVTEKSVIDRIVADENPARALEDALLSGQIGVKKLFDVLGTTVAVGPLEALVGTVGVVAGAVAVTTVGTGGLSAKLGMLVKKLKSLLAEIVVSFKLLLKTLEMLGLDLKERFHDAVWDRLIAPFRRWRGRSTGPTPEDERLTDPDQLQESTSR